MLNLPKGIAPSMLGNRVLTRGDYLLTTPVCPYVIPFIPDFFKVDPQIKKNRMANSVDPDETAHYEPSYQDLHCLQR